MPDLGNLTLGTKKNATPLHANGNMGYVHDFS
jgi:hypothetical protein